MTPCERREFDDGIYWNNPGLEQAMRPYGARLEEGFDLRADDARPSYSYEARFSRETDIELVCSEQERTLLLKEFLELLRLPGRDVLDQLRELERRGWVDDAVLLALYGAW